MSGTRDIGRQGGKGQWAGVFGTGSGDCGYCIPCGIDDEWPMYQDGPDWRLCRAVKSLSGDCVIDLAGDLVIIDPIDATLLLT